MLCCFCCDAPNASGQKWTHSYYCPLGAATAPPSTVQGGTIKQAPYYRQGSCKVGLILHRECGSSGRMRPWVTRLNVAPCFLARSRKRKPMLEMIFFFCDASRRRPSNGHGCAQSHYGHALPCDALKARCFVSGVRSRHSIVRSALYDTFTQYNFEDY